MHGEEPAPLLPLHLRPPLHPQLRQRGRRMDRRLLPPQVLHLPEGMLADRDPHLAAAGDRPARPLPPSFRQASPHVCAALCCQCRTMHGCRHVRIMIYYNRNNKSRTGGARVCTRAMVNCTAPQKKKARWLEMAHYINQPDLSSHYHTRKQ